MLLYIYMIFFFQNLTDIEEKDVLMLTNRQGSIGKISKPPPSVCGSLSAIFKFTNMQFC